MQRVLRLFRVEGTPVLLHCQFEVLRGEGILPLAEERQQGEDQISVDEDV